MFVLNARRTTLADSFIRHRANRNGDRRDANARMSVFAYVSALVLRVVQTSLSNRSLQIMTVGRERDGEVGLEG